MLLPLLMGFLHTLSQSAVLWALTFERVGVFVRFLWEFTRKGDAFQQYATAHAHERTRPVATEQTEVVESGHPYHHNLDTIKTWDFPGAREVRITFDSRSATEHNCDYLRIYRDPRRRDQDLLVQLTGPSGSGCWNTAIATTSTQITFYFHSDGSVNDWGYKATITASYVNSLPFSSPPFAFDLMNELLGWFDAGLPVSRNYQIPESAFGNSEGRESKWSKVRDRLCQFLPGLSSFEMLPDSISELFDCLDSERPRLGELDVTALAMTPARFVPLHPISPTAVVTQVLEMFDGPRKSIPVTLEKLARATTPSAPTK
jgi:hypothetical protein